MVFLLRCKFNSPHLLQAAKVPLLAQTQAWLKHIHIHTSRGEFIMKSLFLFSMIFLFSAVSWSNPFCQYAIIDGEYVSCCPLDEDLLYDTPEASGSTVVTSTGQYEEPMIPEALGTTSAVSKYNNGTQFLYKFPGGPNPPYFVCESVKSNYQYAYLKQ